MQFWTFTYTICGQNFGYQVAFRSEEEARAEFIEFRSRNNGVTEAYFYVIMVR